MTYSPSLLPLDGFVIKTELELAYRDESTSNSTLGLEHVEYRPEMDH